MLQIQWGGRKPFFFYSEVSRRLGGAWRAIMAKSTQDRGEHSNSSAAHYSSTSLFAPLPLTQTRPEEPWVSWGRWHCTDQMGESSRRSPKYT
jgi:hypothetical protein